MMKLTITNNKISGDEWAVVSDNHQLSIYTALGIVSLDIDKCFKKNKIQFVIKKIIQIEYWFQSPFFFIKILKNAKKETMVLDKHTLTLEIINMDQLNLLENFFDKHLKK